MGAGELRGWKKRGSQLCEREGMGEIKRDMEGKGGDLSGARGVSVGNAWGTGKTLTCVESQRAENLDPTESLLSQTA